MRDVRDVKDKQSSKYYVMISRDTFKPPPPFPVCCRFLSAKQTYKPLCWMFTLFCSKKHNEGSIESSASYKLTRASYQLATNYQLTIAYQHVIISYFAWPPTPVSTLASSHSHMSPDQWVAPLDYVILGCSLSSHTYDHARTANTLPTTTPGWLIQFLLGDWSAEISWDQ